MSIIKVMNEQMANKISAGEVVERPLSIVKELIENSIDAESTKIDINLINAGISDIQITDNGAGVIYDDIKLMTKRHATSKIYSDNDLFEVSTLGFRGEALASISAVSKVKIITSTDGITTYQYEDLTKSIKEVGGNKGTIVKIEELFYNTPARFKHLSHQNYELSIILKYIKKVALIFPNIAFSITNDQKLIFKTDGKNKTKNVIRNIYGIEIYDKTLVEKFENDDFEFEIYFTKPEITKAKKNDIVISVNDRLIKNIKIENAIISGYKGFLHTGQFPICFIKIKLDSKLVDVNIHPTKQQVKMSFLDVICREIEKVINYKLSTMDFIPEFKMEHKENYIENNGESIEQKFIIKDEEQIQFNLGQTKDVDWKLPHFEYIGSLYQTYLMFQNEDGLHLLDQHAAQERINYEIFMGKFKNKEFIFQQIMIPIIISLNSEENLLFKNKYNKLSDVGIIIEPFGIDSYKVSEIDNFYLKAGNLANDINKLIHIIIKKDEANFEKTYEDLAIMMACKSSIKANQYLNHGDVNVLLNDLNECENPFTCPHGRPIINKITKYEIEKLFKRV